MGEGHDLVPSSPYYEDRKRSISYMHMNNG